MRKEKKEKITNNKPHTLLFFLAFFFFHSSFLFCQVGFRVMPSFNVPVGREYFSTGVGASASLDWAFLHSRGNKLHSGINVTGSFSNFPLEQTSSFSVLEAGIGPFLQWRINDRFSLRADGDAGIYRYNWEEKSAVKFLAGGSLSAQYHLTPFLSFFADAGYFWHSFSSTAPINNFRFGAGIHLNLTELVRPVSKLNGRKTEQNHVFPVNFTWYEENPLAIIEITNEEPNTIKNIQLSFLLERFMNQPALFTVIDSLAPGEVVAVPVTAMFNESMLDLSDAIVASSQVIAEYRSLGITKTANFHIQMPIHNRNSMTWDDDRRAASFVSSRDPAAVYFARYVSTVLNGIVNWNIPENVQIAAALFEALRLYGITYLIDPASSYIALSEDSSKPDSLNYPYETLLYRGGDCDDLSILFSTLLEVLNIESAFITVPGHIFIAFNINDENWRKGQPGIIEYDGKRWLPVELTVPDRGFSEAIRIGARQLGEDAQIYPMYSNWKIYPPVSVSVAGDNMPSMPQRSEIAKALETELRKLR